MMTTSSDTKMYIRQLCSFGYPPFVPIRYSIAGLIYTLDPKVSA